MKLVLAAVATSVLIAVFVVLAVIEALIQLAPYLLVLATVYFIVRWRIRAHRGPAAGVGPVQAVPPFAPPDLGPAPVLTLGSAAVMPPVTPHYERVYLVRPADTGFHADRTDGYLKVDTPPQPPARYRRPAPNLRALGPDHRRVPRRTRP